MSGQDRLAPAQLRSLFLFESLTDGQLDWLAERGTPVVRVELELKGFGAPVVAFRVRASAEAGLRA